MPSSYSTSLQFELQYTGENTNTWGAKLSNTLARVDDAVAGYTAIALTGSYTLTNTQSNASANEARRAHLKFTGSLVSGATITIPGVSKGYWIWNASGAALTFSTGSGSTVSVDNGDIKPIWCDGTNVKEQTIAGYNTKDYIDQAILATTGSLPATTGNNGKALVCVAGAWTPTLLTVSYVSDFDSAHTFTAKQTFSGSSSVQAALFTNSAEVVTVSATAATGTINYNIASQSVLYYTTNASANWTVNLRHSSGTSLDSAMSVGQSVTVSFLVAQGATAYFNSAVQVDGTTSGVTTKWLNAAPAAGIASSINAYTYTIIKTGPATFTVIASLAAFV